MRRLALTLAAMLLGACSKSPCQELGEKLCSCTGLSSDSCKTQVEDQLKSANLTEDQCSTILDTCNKALPAGAVFCEWLLTEQGKRACGIAVPAP